MTEDHLTTRGMNAVAQGSVNRSAVLRTVLRVGATDRGQLARATGLTAASISRIVDRLLTEGLLREVPDPHTDEPKSVGRPVIYVDLNAASRFVFGMHFGARLIHLGVHNLRGTVMAHAVIPLDHAELPEQALKRCIQTLTQLARDVVPDLSSVIGLGIGIAGHLDSRGVVIDHATLSWAGFPLKATAENLVQMPVIADSSVRAMAAAEAAMGAGAYYRTLAILHVGNVIASAIVARGAGNNDLTILEGNVGHLPYRKGRQKCRCGRRGCIEVLASEDSAAKRVQIVFGDSVPGTGADASVEKIIAAYRLARSGNRDALKLIEERIEVIAVAAEAILSVATPDCLLISGATLVENSDIVLKLLSRYLEPWMSSHDRKKSPVLAMTSFGPQASLVGAAGLILQAFFGATGPFRHAASISRGTTSRTSALSSTNEKHFHRAIRGKEI